MIARCVSIFLGSAAFILDFVYYDTPSASYSASAPASSYSAPAPHHSTQYLSAKEDQVPHSLMHAENDPS